MPMNKGELFREGDVYIDYDWEQVMFRWERNSSKMYRKFYGQQGEEPIPHDHVQVNDAILYGDQITRDDYLKGNPRDEKWLNAVPPRS